jgi:hypothetical protein
VGIFVQDRAANQDQRAPQFVFASGSVPRALQMVATQTVKQQRFDSEFLVDGNATQAAVRAGYSPRTARQQASENLSKPDICAAVVSRLAALERGTIERDGTAPSPHGHHAKRGARRSHPHQGH